MKISEHKAGAVARFIPRVGNAFCYETTIAKPITKDKEGYILVKPILGTSGKYVNIASLPCMLELCAKDSECIYRYHIDKMGYISHKGNVYFAVFSHEDVDVYNRRMQYRAPYLKEAIAQVGYHTKVRNCWIHDVSINGLNISIDEEDFECEVGTKVSVTFEMSAERQPWKVEGEVARYLRRKEDNSYLTIGIYIDTPPIGWAGFVSRLQMEELQRRRQLKGRMEMKSI